MDNITDIIKRISLKAEVFFSGKLCGIQSFASDDKGHLHLLKSGTLTIVMKDGSKQVIDKPSVIFIPGPAEHRILAPQSDGAEMVCATISMESAHQKLLLEAFPPLIVLPLDTEPYIGQTAQWLFDEAFSRSVTRSVMIDKLSEIFLLQVLRYILENDLAKGGVLAALSHPMMARVISKMHNQPEVNWTVDTLADIAAMSRSRFAATFKQIVGLTPNDYLTDVRIALAQEMLQANKPVNLVANLVGYEHGSALARLFRKKLGMSPKQWLKLPATGNNQPLKPSSTAQSIKHD